MNNYIKLEFPAKSQNEAFARAAVGAFASQLDLTCEELADIKTAVSEAVTNSIVHGYSDSDGIIEVSCRISGSKFEVKITDYGVGIEDINLAMQPLYSGSSDEDRSGMGFTVMESFMDTLQVISHIDNGTVVKMTKVIGLDSYV